MSLTLYGIPNCDQVKKARSWLADHQIDVQFHDFKKAGVTPELIGAWLQQLDWQLLVNRKGTTWRKLSEREQAEVQGPDSAIRCMVHNPSVIKRPVLVIESKQNTEILVGFSEENYHRIVKNNNL